MRVCEVLPTTNVCAHMACNYWPNSGLDKLLAVYYVTETGLHSSIQIAAVVLKPVTIDH